MTAVDVRPKPRDFTGEDRIYTKSLINWKNPVYGTTAEAIAKANGLKPCLDRIIVLSYKVEETTRSGIVLSESTKNQEHNATEYAVVIAMGKYAYNQIDPECKVGDHVILTKYAGEITYGATGEKFRVITDRMVSAVLDPEVFPVNEEFFSI